MKTSFITAAVAAMLLLSSCSVFRPAEKTGSSENVTTVAVKAPKKDKKNKNKNKNKGTEASVPESPKGERPTDETLGGGQWQIAAVGDTKITGEENLPYVNFQPSTGRFFASDGCNIVNGDYVLRSDGVMVFSNTLSTMKYCADVPYADAIGAALNGQERLTAESYRLGQDTYLYLKNAAGKAVLTLRRHNMEFLNGNWLVTSINGKQIDDEECNIFIDIAELKTHGNTGCNYFNGDIYIDPAATNAIDFSNMGVTRMACYKTAQETAMLVALEEATTAIAGKNDNTVLLLDRNGKQVMTLKRIPLPAQED